MSSEDNATFGKKPFRFFDLPAELRDQIYDLLPCAGRVIQDSNDDVAYRISRMNRPLQHFMLVSKKFQDEYSTRASKQSDLCIEDNREDDPGIFELESKVTSASAITCELACLSGDQNSELEQHVNMLENIMQRMENSPLLCLGICFGARRDAREVIPEDIIERHRQRLDRLVKIPGLELLELYAHARELSAASEWKKNRRLVASYMRDRGIWKLEADDR